MFAFGCGPSTLLPAEGGGQEGSGEATDGGSGSTTTTPRPPNTTTTSTSTSTSTVTSLDTADEAGGSTFINIDVPQCNTFDYHDICAPCGLFTQDCPEGEKCAPWANDGGTQWNATRCSPIADNPGTPGEPCTMEGSPTSGLDSCELGAMCWNVDPRTLQGTCIAHCAGDELEPVCPRATSCFIGEDEVPLVCLPTCNPLADDCEPSQLCGPNDAMFSCFPPGENAAAADPCELVTDCAAGSTCIASEATSPMCDQAVIGCCSPWCDLSAPDPAASCFDPAQQCVPWFDDPAPEGLESVGICALPPSP